MKDACGIAVEADGMLFNAETVTATRIKEDADYEGVRVRLQGNLGNARVSMQIDIGFGDVVVPKAEMVRYPVLLDFPAPTLRGYTMESTIAEKFHAMVKLGIVTSQMKDFYDIWMLARTFDFSGKTLSDAIEKTFKNRNTPITSDPAVFESLFAADENKRIQWKAFIRKSQLAGAPDNFEEVVAAIKDFLAPVMAALVEGRLFGGDWPAPGPWRKET